MALHLGQLQQLWGPPVTGPLTPAQASIGLEPQAICTDSRQLAAGQLFVPLVGERFDGHVFLPAALEAGAVALLAQAEQLPPAALGALAGSVPLWLVPDTLLAYQQLACLWRRQLPAAVVAVTGSAGKTTTRELIRAALAPLGEVGASSGNENNDVGVPLTLLKATPAQAAVVVEMGMRGLGEIERLSRCACPDVAVITNIGTAHIGRLGSREAIATAKCEITAGLRPDGVVVIPAGDPLLDGALARVWAGRVVRIALAGEGHEAQANLVGQLDGSAGILKLAGEELAGVEVAMPLEGVHHARNLLLALAVARELGLEPTRWQPLEVALPGGRSRRLELGGCGCSMRPITPPPRRCWPPWICWPASPVAALRCWAPCWSSATRAWPCTERWRPGPSAWASMGWWLSTAARRGRRCWRRPRAWPGWSGWTRRQRRQNPWASGWSPGMCCCSRPVAAWPWSN